MELPSSQDPLQTKWNSALVTEHVKTVPAGVAFIRSCQIISAEISKDPLAS